MPKSTIEQSIQSLNSRNKRVEADKAWETSWTRKLLIAGLTYVFFVVFMYVAKLPDPFINAIVPALAFILSTLTVSLIKKWWLNRVYKP